MANPIPFAPRQLSRKITFAIVASEFNGTYVQGLVDAASNELHNLQPGCNLQLFSVPGAFEIPIVVQEVALRIKPAAILAMGVILRGETDHARLIARTVTDALQRIALAQRIPVLDVVLSLRDEAQAHARCIDPEMNRGIDAARAAVQLVATLGELQTK